jgi:hypothetical protein
MRKDNEDQRNYRMNLIRVMLNGVSGYLLSIPKKKIKKRFNIEKVIFTFSMC